MKRGIAEGRRLPCREIERDGFVGRKNSSVGDLSEVEECVAVTRQCASQRTGTSELVCLDHHLRKKTETTPTRRLYFDTSHFRHLRQNKSTHHAFAMNPLPLATTITNLLHRRQRPPRS